MARTAPTVEEAFRRLSMGDLEFATAIADKDQDVPVEHLDARTEALLRFGALVAIDAPPSSYRAVVASAMRAGARLEDLFAVLKAVAGEVGSGPSGGGRAMDCARRGLRRGGRAGVGPNSERALSSGERRAALPMCWQALLDIRGAADSLVAGEPSPL